MKISQLDYIFKSMEGDEILVSIKVKDENGQIIDGKIVKALKNGNVEVEAISKPVPLTFKTICVQALHALRQDERIDGNEKERRGALAKKIYEAEKEVEGDIDDIKLLKDLIGKDGSPLIVYQSYQILDPKTHKS